MKSKSGQVALILIVVTAMALIFYAVSLNFGRVSQTKTVTQIGAATGASQLGSQMASYGQSLFMETLGGKKKVCAPTALLIALIGVLIAIIALILAPFSVGQSFQLLLIVIAIVSLTLAIVNLILQATVVQPGITAMWNKQLNEILTLKGQFLENSIQTAMQGVGTDNVKVIDLFDHDTDRLWGFDGSGEIRDMITRYGVYYNEKRVKSVGSGNSGAPAVPIDQVSDFIAALREFMYKGTDDWGLHDPGPAWPECVVDDPGHPCCYLSPADPKIIPSVCNPCCIPFEAGDPRTIDPSDPSSTEIVRIRPDCCDCFTQGTCTTPEEQCGTASTCGTGSPYPGSGSFPDPDVGFISGSDYPYVFETAYENWVNNPHKIINPETTNTYSEEYYNYAQCNSCPPLGSFVADNGRGGRLQEIPFCEATSGGVVGSRLCGVDEIETFADVFPVIDTSFAEVLGECVPLTGCFPQPSLHKFDMQTKCIGASDVAVPGGFLSFREKLGRDDEHQGYFKNIFTGGSFPSPFYQVVHANVLDENFYIDDATGYAVPPFLNPITPEINPGVFPFFHRISEWDLMDLNIVNYSDPANPEVCFYCDPDYDAGCSPCDLSAAFNNIEKTPPELLLLGQLDLPVDPATLLCNQTGIVDGASSVPGASCINALALDKIALPGYIIADPDVCADFTFKTGDPRADPGIGPAVSQGFWKKGGDILCSTEWPYRNACVKSGRCDFDDGVGGLTTRDCECGEDLIGGYSGPGPGPPSLWPDDVLDQMVYRLPEFFGAVQLALNQWEDSILQTSINWKVWYSALAEWVEPVDGNGPCVLCDNSNDGMLIRWRDAMREISRRLTMWKEEQVYTGNSCTEVWCVPPDGQPPGANPQYGNGECFGVSDDEKTALDAFPRGSLESVISCLDWNVNDVRGYVDGSIRKGNAEKFRKCYDQCSEDTCEDLPRSLTDLPCFRQPDVHQPQLMACLNTATCGGGPGPPPIGLDTVVFEYEEWSAELGSCPECVPPNDPTNPAYCYQLATKIATCAPAYAGHLTCPNIEAMDVDTCPAGYTLVSKILQAGYPIDFGIPNCTTKSQSYMQRVWDVTCQQNVNPAVSDVLACAANCCDSSKPRLNDEGVLIPCESDIPYTGSPGTDRCNSDAPYPSYSSLDATTWVPPEWVPFPCEPSYVPAADERMGGCAPAGNITCPGDPACPQIVWNHYQQTIDLRACSYCWTDPLDPATFDPALIAPDGITPCEALGGTSNIVCPAGYVEVSRIPLVTVENNIVPPECSPGIIPRVYTETWTVTCESTTDIPVQGACGCAKLMPNSCGDAAFFTDIEDAHVESLRSCNPADPEQFVDKVYQSSQEAYNQVEKMKKRLEYLEGRVKEADEVIALMDEGDQKFTEFLDGPVADIMDNLNIIDEDDEDLPYHLIYAWQDNPSPNKVEGYWHIVKVDARLPGRCDSRCGINGAGDPRWPWVKTYTTNAGFTRCYELSSTDGMVKMRVTRFDEDRETNLLTFPNGLPIWDFSFSHPERGNSDLNLLQVSLGDGTYDGTCAAEALPDPAITDLATYGHHNIYKGAYLLNERRPPSANFKTTIVQSHEYKSYEECNNCGGPSACVAALPNGNCVDIVDGTDVEPYCPFGYALNLVSENQHIERAADCCNSKPERGVWNRVYECIGPPDPGNLACWDRSIRILSNGVTSEMCAEYYFHGGMREGMSFQFVECGSDF